MARVFLEKRSENNFSVQKNLKEEERISTSSFEFITSPISRVLTGITRSNVIVNDNNVAINNNISIIIIEK